MADKRTSTSYDGRPNGATSALVLITCISCANVVSVTIGSVWERENVCVSCRPGLLPCLLS